MNVEFLFTFGYWWVSSLRTHKLNMAFRPLSKGHIPIYIYTYGLVVNSVRACLSLQVKKAISYALGQSTKLSIFEERISTHTEEAVELPKMLADTGNITINRKEISKLIGRVFLEKCAVNLLGNVLDTPEFFWNAPDSLQSLYDAVCEYLEMEDRVQVRA